MSARNCTIAGSDARWCIECWQPIKQRLITLGYEVGQRLPELNTGGCGLFAGLVGQRLEKLGYRVRVLISGADSRANARAIPSLNTIEKRVGQTSSTDMWRLQGMSYISHVLLKLYGEVFDSTGFAPIGVSDPMFLNAYYRGSVSVEAMMGLAAETAAWHPNFDHRKGIPVIKALIDKYLPLEETA